MPYILKDNGHTNYVVSRGSPRVSRPWLWPSSDVARPPLSCSRGRQWRRTRTLTTTAASCLELTARRCLLSLRLLVASWYAGHPLYVEGSYHASPKSSTLPTRRDPCHEVSCPGHNPTPGVAGITTWWRGETSAWQVCHFARLSGHRA